MTASQLIMWMFMLIAVPLVMVAAWARRRQAQIKARWRPADATILEVEENIIKGGPDQGDIMGLTLTVETLDGKRRIDSPSALTSLDLERLKAKYAKSRTIRIWCDPDSDKVVTSFSGQVAGWLVPGLFALAALGGAAAIALGLWRPLA